MASLAQMVGEECDSTSEIKAGGGRHLSSLSAFRKLTSFTGLAHGEPKYRANRISAMVFFHDSGSDEVGSAGE